MFLENLKVMNLNVHGETTITVKLKTPETPEMTVRSSIIVEISSDEYTVKNFVVG